MTSNDNRTRQWEKKKCIRQINRSDGHRQFVKRELSLKWSCRPKHTIHLQTTSCATRKKKYHQGSDIAWSSVILLWIKVTLSLSNRGYAG